MRETLVGWAKHGAYIDSMAEEKRLYWLLRLGNEVDTGMKRQAVQRGESPVSVHPPVHVGPSMEQLENVLILAPLEANLIVQNLYPEYTVDRDI